MQRHEIQQALHAHAGTPGVVVPGAGDGERSDVLQVCPECGGQLTSLLDASSLVRVCWACEGRGTMNDQQLSTYMSRLNAKAANKPWA